MAQRITLGINFNTSLLFTISSGQRQPQTDAGVLEEKATGKELSIDVASELQGEPEDIGNAATFGNFGLMSSCIGFQVHELQLGPF